jgi:hypothetical protein
MRQIFTGASRVIVWLGEEASARLGLSFCEELAEVRRMEVSEVYGGKSWLQKAYDPRDLGRNYERDREKWEACEELFSGRRWWSRTWIIQEVLHGGAVEFRMGHIVVPLEEMQTKYRMYMTMKARADQTDLIFSTDTQLDRAIASHTLLKTESGTGPFAGMDRSNIANKAIASLKNATTALHHREVLIVLDGTFRYFKGLQSGVTLSLIAEARESVNDVDEPFLRSSNKPGRTNLYPLETLLRIFRSQAASDPRDKVYAFLGMATSTYGIPVDYRASKRSVYLRTVRQLRRFSGLDSFLLAVESPDRPPGLPGRRTTSHVPSIPRPGRSISGSTNKTTVGGDSDSHGSTSDVRHARDTSIDTLTSRVNPKRINYNELKVLGVRNLKKQNPSVGHSGDTSQTSTHDNELPSWVPDWSTKQMLVSRFMEEWAGDFNANAGRRVGDVLSLSSFAPAGVYTMLKIRGIYVGRVTGTVVKGLHYGSGGADDKVKLIKYDRDPTKRYWQKSSLADECGWPVGVSGSEVTLANTSWGPWWAEVGDIIVVAAGSQVPLVLRKADGKDEYIFVGGCLLIDSQLQTLGKGCIEEEKGFSRLMFGSAWDGVKEDDLEEFELI